jgi:hypothetical protein
MATFNLVRVSSMWGGVDGQIFFVGCQLSLKEVEA